MGDYRKKSYYGNKNGPNAEAFEETQSKNPKDQNLRRDLDIKYGINNQKNIQEPSEKFSHVRPRFPKGSFEQTSTYRPRSQENDLNRRTSRTEFQHNNKQFCNIKGTPDKNVRLRTSESSPEGTCEVSKCRKNFSISQRFDHSSKSVTCSDSENFQSPKEKNIFSSTSDVYNNGYSSGYKNHLSPKKKFPSLASDTSSCGYSSRYKNHQSPKKNFPSSANDTSSCDHSSGYKNPQGPKKNFPSLARDISSCGCSSVYKNPQSPKKNFPSSTSDISSCGYNSGYKNHQSIKKNFLSSANDASSCDHSSGYKTHQNPKQNFPSSANDASSCDHSSGYKNHQNPKQNFPSSANDTSNDYRCNSRDKFSKNPSGHQYSAHNSNFERVSHNHHYPDDNVSKTRNLNRGRNKMATFAGNSSHDNQESGSQFESQTFPDQKKDCSTKTHRAISDSSAPKVNGTVKKPLGQRCLNIGPDNCDTTGLGSCLEDSQSNASCSYTNSSIEPLDSQSHLFHMRDSTPVDIGAEIKAIIRSVLNPASSRVYLPKKQCGVEWSTLLRTNGASDEVIRAVKNEEYHRYVNQPAHKEGDGLYYSEFDDLPPRFKEKALQAILLSTGVDLKKVVANTQSSALNATNVSGDNDKQMTVAVNMVNVNGSSDASNIDLHQKRSINPRFSNEVSKEFLSSKIGKVNESFKQSKEFDKLCFHDCDVKSMFQNVLNVVGKRENEYQKVPHLNSEKNYVTFLEVFVSNNAVDTDYWNSYLFDLSPFVSFVIEDIHPATQRFHLMFSDTRAARQMHVVLRKHNRNKNKPHVVQVSRPKPYCIKIRDSGKSNLEKCICDIFKLYDDYKKMHSEKMNFIYQEIKQLRKNVDDASKNERDVLNAKYKMFKEMETVFKNYYQKIHDYLVSESSIIAKKAILDLKIRFKHECNNLAGCLPVYAKKDEIINMVSREQVSVLIADTGSGKSTQLVQYLLHEDFTKDGWIVCTQPRKIAAVSICRYVSGLLCSQLGRIVGYDTGFSRKIFDSTRIVYMTDYTLLRKCVRNKKLKGISCIILDEAHERSLYTDLLLGLIKHCLPLRKDLKVIITSATINPSIFLEYFKKQEDVLLKIPGRQYPVEIIWQDFDVFPGFNYLEASVKCAFDVHCQSGKGGILVFLTSPDETEEAITLFHQLQNKNRNRVQPFQAKLMSLHGKLDVEDQLQIFNPIDEDKYRKVLFATNSAETSITVPGIRYVVDSGMIKERKYDSDRKRGILAVGFVTQSSAEQRKGRAGRTQPGVCYRMYSKKDFERDMAENPVPEILRVNLQQAVLEILHLGIQPENFDFISRPSKTSIEDALESLENLGAVKDKRVTELGEKIVKIPLEPQLSKLILSGEQEGIGYASVIVAAMVAASRNIFLRPEDDKILADKIKLPFCCEEGDFHTLWWVFKQWERVPKDRKLNWCKNNFINSKAMSIGLRTVNELCFTLSTELNISIPRTKYNGQDFDHKFQKVLFDSFSDNLCVFSGQERSGYLSPFLEGSFFIHPSSSLRYLGVKMPKFVIFGCILKTSRAFLHNVCPISEKTIVEAHQAGNFHLQIDLLKQLEVLPNVIQPIGESVLSRYILGKEGSKIREMEDVISVMTKTRSSYLDINVKKGEIVTYVEAQYQKSVNELITRRIHEAHIELGKEQMICSVSEHLSISLTLGGEIEDILLPGEFKELSIECRKSFFNIPKLKSELDMFNLVSYYELESSGKPKVQAVFANVADAKKAFKKLKTNEDYIVTSKPYIPCIIDKPLSFYVIEISWWRLPCKGTGWIVLQSYFDCLTASNELTRIPICIKGTCINVEPARKNNQSLYMRNVPPMTEEEDILTVLKERLQKSVSIKGVSLVRIEDSKIVTDSDLYVVKKQLQRTFAPYTSLKNLTIDVKRPNKDDRKWKATLYFNNIEEGEKAMTQLKDNLKIGDYKAKLTSSLTSSIHLRSVIYEVLDREIEALRKKYKKRKTYVEFQIERKGNSFVCVNFHCENTEYFIQVRKDLMRLVQGYHIECAEDKRLLALLSSGSLRSLNEIQSSYNTLILTDSIRKILSIYGPESSCMSTKSAIYSLAYASQKAQRKKYNLRGENMPSGFLKALYNRYGFSLVEFVKKFHLSYAYINLRRYQLILEGSVKRIEEAEAHLEEICAELEQNSINEKKDRLNSGVQNETVHVCPVCFDETQTDSIRLEHCGHAVCRPCLQLQVQSEVFPLTCIQVGCEKPFFIEDLRRIFAGQEDLKKGFFEAALKHFVNTNSQTIHYCPSPNCSMVYRTTSDGTEFSCPGCENDICTTCHALYHHGMSCEMYQLSKIDSDHSVKMDYNMKISLHLPRVISDKNLTGFVCKLVKSSKRHVYPAKTSKEVWLKEDIENRKTCPECNSAIEKDGGCNHVTCLNCKSHMCWLCLRTFKTADEVYEHMPFCEENS